MKNKTSIYRHLTELSRNQKEDATISQYIKIRQDSKPHCTNCEGLHNGTWEKRQLKIQEHLPLLYFQSFKSCMSTAYQHTEPRFSREMEKRWQFLHFRTSQNREACKESGSEAMASSPLSSQQLETCAY